VVWDPCPPLDPHTVISTTGNFKQGIGNVWGPTIKPVFALQTPAITTLDNGDTTAGA